MFIDQRFTNSHLSGKYIHSVTREELIMSAMPVVWCTDPNSVSKKPTAFALHGIQLQGNLSELQVLALRELVSAAAEGRLLIPTDGATVQLDCGISIGSAIVKEKQTSVKPTNEAEEPIAESVSQFKSFEETNDKHEVHQSCRSNESCITIDRLFSANTFCSHPQVMRTSPDPPADNEGPEPKYSDDIYHNPPPPNHYDELYAFLCCAKCISDPAVSRVHAIASGNNRDRRPHFTSHRSKLSLDHVTYVTNRYLKKNALRHHNRKQSRKTTNTWSLKKLKIAIGSPSSKYNQQHKGRDLRWKEVDSPLYAMVKKGSLHKIPPDEIGKVHERDVVLPFDSFGNQENDLLQDNLFAEPTSNTSSRKTSFDSSCTEHGSTDSGFIEMQNRLSANTIETPEELSAPVVVDTEHLSVEDDQPSSLQFNIKECLALKSRNRRKSYEEFKAIFKKPTSPIPRAQNPVEPSVNVIKSTPRPSDKVKSRRKSYEEFKQLVKDCDAVLNEQRLERKNSKRHCRKFSSPTLGSNSIERQSILFSQQADKESSSVSNDTKICGTIYDILHRKISAPVCSNRENVAPVKRLSSRALYDKMLSYGTLYDIVQQKQDDGSYQKYDQYMTYGTIYEILQRKSEDYEVFQRKRALSDKCIKRGLARFATGTKYNTLNFGTIYDILQRKQAFLDEGMPSAVTTSRFSVKKVSEDELTNTVAETITSDPKALPPFATPEYSETKPSKKTTRIRRFSNILSYTPRYSTNETPRFSLENIPPSIAEVLDPTPAEIQQELYSRVRRHTSADIIQTNVAKPTSISNNELPKVHTRKIGLGFNQSDVLHSLQAIKCDKIHKSENRQPVVEFAANTSSVERSMSITTRKALWRKDKSRRLSEFTRGEFLNEKS